MAMIAVAHPGSSDDLDEALQERERQPRQRRGLDEIAFAGDWEQPL